MARPVARSKTDAESVELVLPQEDTRIDPAETEAVIVVESSWLAMKN